MDSEYLLLFFLNFNEIEMDIMSPADFRTFVLICDILYTKCVYLITDFSEDICNSNALSYLHIIF